MLQVVTGLFHPELEQSLAADLRSLKVADPFAPCLVLVPSESLRPYLKWTLCAEKGQPLFNVHVLTFYQLALRVLEEQGRHVSSQLRSDAFFREWVHRLLLKRGAELVGLQALASMPGSWAALWATLKDLKDAKVDPESVEEALSHSPFSGDRRLRSVIRLYRAIIEARNAQSCYDHDDLAVLAGELLSASSFLRQQAHIFYYGFYDLTQVQLDIFHTIVKQYPTTLYFPLLDKHPAFRFAQQFFDQHILGLATGAIDRRVEAVNRLPFRSLFDPAKEFDGSTSYPRIAPPGDGVPAARPPCRLMTVSGAHDEIEVVAKEIRALVQEQQIPLHDIGVVGRTLSGYEDVLPRVFSEQGIPFQSTLRRPLIQYPFPKAVLNLLTLRLSNLDRQTTFDVLHAPFVNWQGVCPDVDTPRPALWEQASRQLGINKGLDEWQRLARYVETGLVLESRRRQAETTVDGREIQNLWRVIRRLDRLLQEFPEQASWEVFTDRTLSLMDAVFTGASSEQDAGTVERIAQAVVDCVTEIRDLAQAGDPIPYAEFLATLQRFLEECLVPVQPDRENGVWVGDAMAARGLSFRFVFVVGLTDQAFPRHIQEDAFLRDPVRRFLEMNLGFKIQEKARGYDEEKVLFTLLVHAAREQVTLVVQRSDEEGRAIIPSWYLQEVQRCLPELAPVDIPKSMLQKSQTEPYASESRWTPRERLIRNVLQRRKPTQAPAEARAWWEILHQGLATLRMQESGRPRLNAYDGMTDHLPEYWQWLRRHGLSPTSLEHYARCPFQYFAREVLGLQATNEPKASEGMRPVEIGALVHEMVKEWYGRLSRQGWFDQAAPSDDLPRRILKEAAESVFREFERTHPVGPALLWEMQQEQLLTMLERIMEQDVKEMGRDWIPVLFELPLKGEMTVAEAAEAFPIAGRLDRVDWSPVTHRYRIIDYKFTARTSGLTTEKSIAKDVVRGTSLQPLIYMELAKQGIPQRLQEVQKTEIQTSACDGVWLYVVAPQALKGDQGFAPVPFSADTCDRLKPQLETTMATIVEGIRHGKFFFVQGEQCHWCDVRRVCHRTHQGSARRAREDRGQTQAHRSLRRQEPLLLPASSSKPKPRRAGTSGTSQ